MKHNHTTISFYFLFTVIIFLQIVTPAQQKPLAEAKLVVDSYSPQKDSVISIGVLVNLTDDWHIYWRNPGDSGLPTEIEFKLPQGLVASENKFPVPKIFFTEEIVNYGYGHQVLFINELLVPKDFPQKTFSISAKLTSLICKDLCKSFDTTITIIIDFSKDYVAETEISELFEKTKNLLPQINRRIKASALLKSDSVYLKVSGDDILGEHDIKFLSYEAGVLRNSVTQNIIKKENYIELILEPDPFRITNPTELEGIIILNDNPAKTFEIKIPITD